MCHGLVIFRFRPTQARPMDCIMLGVTTPSPQSNNKVSAVAVSLWKQGIHSLTNGQIVFLLKCPDCHQRVYGLCHTPPMRDLPPFLGYKTPHFFGCQQSLG